MRDIIAKAVRIADMAHDGQLRKFSGIPYINHPFEVMNIVSSVSDDEDMIAAAVLHDVIEDCDVTYTDLVMEFNENIAGLVYAVTNAATKEDGDRITRAYINRNVLANKSADAQTIKLADIISNLNTIDLAFQCDPAWAKMYLEEKIDLINVLTKGDPGLRKRAASIAAEGVLKCSML
ncbi:HDc domain containing protein [uncultured Caudovirales phage]|jgi:(p)ppGpp synthase/HD superfamily hydrolase|uniref:HDc domain containing protein n=1 Tax=uncultured Caudovirales phage TaxID=2100421 RepID=A0A6J5P0J2_9CAUD|nr:HDc domain containing protein [uncultured Caudovirales phage]